MISSLFVVVGCALADNNPPDAYYMGPGGTNCPGNDMLANYQDCADAVKVLKHTRLNKRVRDKGRPLGCFWDSNGLLYFNELPKDEQAQKFWAGTGPVCKRKGEPFLKIGELTANDAKYKNGLAFSNTVWITQDAAKKQAEFFYPDSGDCPTNQQIWLHKEYDGSEDMAGPFMINGCDQDDRGLYKITIAGSFGVGGRTFPTAFNFRDVLYISKFECRNKECPKENTYQAGECTGPANDEWTCPACNNTRCEQYEFRTGKCSQADGNNYKCNAQPTCGPGEYYSTERGGGKASCMACPQGTFRADDDHREANCAQWSDDCSDNELETQAPSATQNRACSTSTVCSDDQFESNPKTDKKDRECTGITACTAGQYVYQAATATSDNQCKDCNGVDEFTEAAGSEFCDVMSSCNPGEYVSTPGTASSDLECSKCGDETYQDAVDHRETECMPQTMCGPGQVFEGNKYMLSKTEAITCAECPDGRFMPKPEHRETRCTLYSSRKCGRDEMMVYQDLKTQDAECVDCPEGQHQPDFYHTNPTCQDTTSTSTNTMTTKTFTATTRTTVTDTSATETTETATTVTATATTMTETATDKDAITTAKSGSNNDDGDSNGDGGGDNDGGGGGGGGDGDGGDGDDDKNDGDGGGSSSSSTGTDPNASTGGKTNSGSSTTTVVIVVVALLIVIAVVAVAAIRVRQQNAGGAGANAPPGAFDNPLYDVAGNNTPAFDPAYVDPVQNSSAGYMDVGMGGGAGATSGYMDVGLGGAGGAEASSGYMDVGGGAAQQAESDDEEEV